MLLITLPLWHQLPVQPMAQVSPGVLFRQCQGECNAVVKFSFCSCILSMNVGFWCPCNTLKTHARFWFSCSGGSSHVRQRAPTLYPKSLFCESGGPLVWVSLFTGSLMMRCLYITMGVTIDHKHTIFLKFDFVLRNISASRVLYLTINRKKL